MRGKKAIEEKKYLGEEKMMNAFMNAKTAKILVPDVVVSENKNGKKTLVPTLTKSGNIAKRQKEKVIDIQPGGNFTGITVENDGSRTDFAFYKTNNKKFRMTKKY